ncbi:MAG: hypothetical protein JWR60_3083 [Polaromonas sp.]|nr:hypothetical protein [Polaromonas sp.]
MTEELKPCPFCGHAPDPENLIDLLYPTGTYWREEDGLRHYFRRSHRKEGDGQVWSFGCLTTEGGCGVFVHADARDEVLAAWNRRPDQSAQAAP